MAGKYEKFDVSRIEVLPLEQREHDLDLSIIKEMVPSDTVREPFAAVARNMVEAKARGAANVFMMGAHAIRSGIQPYLIDLMERGYISCLALNGAGIIHDYEFALIGQTTESVARYIRDGRFGLWRETGALNDVINEAAKRGEGLGECVGRHILESGLPHEDISLLAAGYRLGVPVTVHIGIGYDIIHQHPNFDGAASGRCSHTDFLYYARVLQSLQGGTVSSFGTAVMGPEVFLKALSMVRNAARQRGEAVDDFTTMVCDLKELPETYRTEASKSDPNYYFRPWKTMLVRTVEGKGGSWYVRETHANAFPELWTAIGRAERGE
ncbi:hypothetical protein GM415_04275 [Pseudodesulfovibrio cashew]|uniref:Deoxyhypusine synthase n=1 Tax=Pseudodesulfovibrio cashew TaxID=2678688 RepID=A0A6I6JED3_9BACT|nr:hypothetical protein [Pseudodesulfovibrio cashew]QGY39368.1 hypothetical protein GM415_04275 [Pseudodesulfovibrio cashew]